MGLYITQGCWHGSYDAFHSWRLAIAEAGGYGVEKTLPDSPGWPSESCSLDWSFLPDGVLHGEWDVTPEDPLLVLLAHSDCDGRINPAQAGPLADRLEALLPAMNDKWQSQTKQCVLGLRKAANAGEPVHFY